MRGRTCIGFSARQPPSNPAITGSPSTSPSSCCWVGFGTALLGVSSPGGAIHGVLLGAGRVFRSITGVNPDRHEQPAVSRIVRVLVTFHLVAGCFVVFRAQDWGVIRDYFTTLAAVRPGSVEVTPIAMAVLMVAALWEVMPRTWITSVAVTLIRLPSPVQAGAVTVCLLVFAALGGASPPFIYFQF